MLKEFTIEIIGLDLKNVYLKFVRHEAVSNKSTNIIIHVFILLDTRRCASENTRS